MAGTDDDGAAAPPTADRDAAAVTELLDRAVAALGGGRREGQVTMARAVAEALGTGEHLLVQAGTGTGKSLGYLVPAIRHAVVADERVVVSTATLALQRQVLSRDLPLVVEAVTDRLPRPPQVALLKGWHNYVCVHKVAGGYPQDEPGTLFDAVGEPPGAAEHPAGGRAGTAAELGRQVVRLREWAEETSTGDRDDLVPGVSDRAWRQVSVTALECLGPRCPMLDQCFPEAARARAREADVVVTNHAMLGIAASGSPGVLPEHDVLVVDEAHELADRVTAQSTVELSQASVEAAARLARRHGGLGTTDLDAAAQGLGSVLALAPEGRFVGGPPEEVATAVAAVRDAARALVTALKPEPGAAAQQTAEGGIKVAAGAMLALFEVADRMTGDAVHDGRDVVWCSRPDGGPSRLHAAPLAVSGLVRSHLLAGRTAVLTSATLRLGGEFAPLARALGLRPGEEVADDRPAGPARRPARPSSDAPEPAGEAMPWRGLDVGSPFDYPRRGILYVARHLPPPGRDAAAPSVMDELADLVTAAGGATLGLFSSRRAAEAAAQALRERLDVPVLCQGDDTLPTLVRQFTEDEETCLFGTLSLWQGVDVPGPTCRLVVIDRIPFPRPDDPVRSARTEAVAASGGNGFMTVAATHAALLLAQGAGRLVRTETDRGVVAVLDPRLVTARYGSFLLGSLPPFWRTTDRATVLDALTRLRETSAAEPAAGP